MSIELPHHHDEVGHKMETNLPPTVENQDITINNLQPVASLRPAIIIRGGISTSNNEATHETNHDETAIPTIPEGKTNNSYKRFGSILYYLLFGNRLIAFLIGALLTFLSGTHYAYSSISPTIKNDMNFSQTQTNLIGTAANIGTYFALPVSILNDFVGSRITCVVSGLLLFLGYFLFYLVYIQVIDIPSTDSYVFIACCMAVMGQGSAGVSVLV